MFCVVSSTITDFTVSEELSPGFIVTNITAVVPDDSFYIIYSIGTNNYLAIHSCEYTAQSYYTYLPYFHKISIIDHN